MAKTVNEFLSNFFRPDIMVQCSLHVMTCPVCGVLYALPTAFAETQRHLEESLYCPAGHKWHWVDSLEAMIEEHVEPEDPDRDSAEVKKLRRALVQEKHRCEQLEAKVSDKA